MKISEAFNSYRQTEIISAGLSRKTYENYKNSEKLLVRFIGNKSITKITEMNVVDYYKHLSTWQKPDTARGNIICLRSVLRHCRRNGHKVLYEHQVKIPKRQKTDIKFLNLKEMNDFITWVGKSCRGYAKVNRLRNIAIVELLFASGIRVGELCSLNRNSIKNCQFTVIGKSKNPRICFITERAEMAINRYLEVRSDKNPALFVSKAGDRINTATVRRIFEFTCKRSGYVNVHPHTIRHSFATHMLDKEVELIYIAQLLGHESLDTTKMYTHFSNPKLKKIYERAQC